MKDMKTTFYRGGLFHPMSSSVSYNAPTVSPTVLFDIQLLSPLFDPLRAGLFFGRDLCDRFHIYLCTGLLWV